MQRILLLGFKPFLNYDTNPSEKIVKTLTNTYIKKFKIIGKVLPVKHLRSSLLAEKEIRKSKPSIVISLGLAGMRGTITIERIAINRYYFVENKKVTDERLENGHSAYFSTLPIKRIKSNIEKEGIPTEYSFCADTYVSNEVFYAIMKIAKEIRIKYAGFIHLPYTHEQVITNKNIHYMRRAMIPSISERDELKAIKIAIETCIDNL